MFSVIKKFNNQYLVFSDRLLIGLIASGMIAGFGLILLNDMDFHFATILLFATHVDFLSWTQGLATFFLCCIFLFYGLYIRKIYPHAATFIWGCGVFAFVALTNIVLVNGIQSTPFPPIDEYLAKIDRIMGVHTTALLAWTYHHPFFHKVLRDIYNGLAIELLGIPLILTVFCARKRLTIFYLAQLISLFAGSAIYYFFPTMAPSGIFNSPYFTAHQHDTSMRFFDVHHFIHINTTQGGLIAFPSFHVIWAILLTNCCYGKKIIFYPLAFVNLILITSTVLLGWHYLVDVFGGIILGVGAIVLAKMIYRRDAIYGVSNKIQRNVVN